MQSNIHPNYNINILAVKEFMEIDRRYTWKT